MFCPRPKSNVAPCASSMLLDTSVHRRGERDAGQKVICVCHATFTVSRSPGGVLAQPARESPNYREAEKKENVSKERWFSSVSKSCACHTHNPPNPGRGRFQRRGDFFDGPQHRFALTHVSNPGRQNHLFVGRPIRPPGPRTIKNFLPHRRENSWNTHTQSSFADRWRGPALPFGFANFMRFTRRSAMISLAGRPMRAASSTTW
jgi:hypothetical protein